MMVADHRRPPIKVALLGLGRAMLNEHYPVFKAHPSLFKVVAACDLEKERRDRIAPDLPDCKMFRRYLDMFDERDIDLVVIATPSVGHAKEALASLQRGFWTLVETPMALNIDDLQVLRGAALKAKGRLVVRQRGLFDPDFLLAKQMVSDSRLGEVHQICIRCEDYVRRACWQTVKRLGGGAAYYAMTDLLVQAQRLMSVAPTQMWSELKRIAALGDAEDYVHVCLKTRGLLTADIEYSGGTLAENRSPSFRIRGTLGEFSVMPGEATGKLTVVDPAFTFSRRRSAVRTPDLVDQHEAFPVKTYTVELPRGNRLGESAFWWHLYNTIRTAAPLPLTIDESMEALRLAYLMKKTSPYGL